MYLPPQQNIHARNWQIKEMGEYFVIVSGDRIADTRRSSAIVNVKYNEDHAEVKTESGSLYLLYPEEMNSNSLHKYENLSACVNAPPELTGAQKIKFDEYIENQAKATEEFHKIGGFF